MTDWVAVNELVGDLVPEPDLGHGDASAVCFIECHRSARRAISAEIISAE